MDLYIFLVLAVAVVAICIAAIGRSNKVTLLSFQAPVAHLKSVPRRLWRTCHLRHAADLVAPAALGNFQNEGIWSDSACKDFLQVLHPQLAVAWDELREGAHRGDLWRYAVLFVHGGVYLDVKTVPLVNLENFVRKIDASAEGLFGWSTVINYDNTEIYNGIIVTPPGNPILWRAMWHAADWENIIAYEHNVVFLRNEIEVVFETESLAEGFFHKDDMRLLLLQEDCSGEVCNIGPRVGGSDEDRYGRCCRAILEGQTIFQIRDPRYPWSNAEEKRKSEQEAWECFELAHTQSTSNI